MLRINILSRGDDAVLRSISSRCGIVDEVGSLDEMRASLEARAACPPPELARARSTLDLLGHSATPARFLQLGRSLVNMCDLGTAEFFRCLARDGLLGRLRITALRLLGCETAVESAARHTMRQLASTLAIPVYGTTKPILASHYVAGGFDPAFEHILVESAAVTCPGSARRVSP